MVIILGEQFHLCKFTVQKEQKANVSCGCVPTCKRLATVKTVRIKGLGSDHSKSQAFSY